MTGTRYCSLAGAPGLRTILSRLGQKRRVNRHAPRQGGSILLVVPARV